MFDKRAEYESQVEPLVKQIAELCRELGIGTVMGFCTAMDITDHDGDEGFAMSVLVSLDRENASCQLQAAAVIFDEEEGHHMAHAVLEAKMKEEMEEMKPQFLDWLEENKEEVKRVIAEKIREMEQGEAAKFN